VAARLERIRVPVVCGLVTAIVALSAAIAAGPPLEWLRSAAWLNVYAILGLLFVLGSGRTETPPALRFVSDATYGIYLLHFFFVTGIQPYFPPAPLRADVVPIAIPWLAGVLGPLVLIVALRSLLGERSRDWIGA
jgi:peptidoglycan/LPS O-acetylase OafA/YrhL